MNRSRTVAAVTPRLRVAVAICAALALYLLGRWISRDLVSHLGSLMLPHNEPLLHRMLMTTMAVYIVLMMVPFMPAAEIGFSILVIFGGKIAFLVYVSTVTALVLSYGLGRLFPVAVTARIFGGLGLKRAQEYVQRLAPLSKRERLALLERESPPGMLSRLVRYHVPALALLLNVPGNVLIGGGGGIAMLAGMTRLLAFPVYLLTVAIAVAPIPLLVYVTD